MGELTNYRGKGYIHGAGYVDVGLEIAAQPVLLLKAKKFGALPSSSERTAFANRAHIHRPNFTAPITYESNFARF